eukprot:6194090-Pleurochrysis_carterae.AAC.1
MRAFWHLWSSITRLLMASASCSLSWYVRLSGRVDAPSWVFSYARISLSLAMRSEVLTPAAPYRRSHRRS